MTITVNTKAFALDSYASKDKVIYQGPSHTVNVKDVLGLGRVAPKPTATFAGVARAEAKFTRTLTLADSTTAEAIATASFSIPVGAAQADVNSLVDDLGDLLISQNGLDLVWKSDINQ